MSGGSLDYAYSKVQIAADQIRHMTEEELKEPPENRRHDAPLLLAFAEQLDIVADALKAVEWDFSSDASLDSEGVLAMYRIGVDVRSIVLGEYKRGVVENYLHHIVNGGSGASEYAVFVGGAWAIVSDSSCVPFSGGAIPEENAIPLQWAVPYYSCSDQEKLDRFLNDSVWAARAVEDVKRWTEVMG